MKRIIVFASLALLFASCKKNSDDSSSTATNTIQATINGTTSTFNVGTNATLTNGTGIHTLTISGLDGAGITANDITIDISSAAVIAANTYSEGAVPASSHLYYTKLSSGDQYVDAGSTSNPVSVTITSITGTSVQGTFKGDIYLDGDISSTKKVFANGKFNVNF